MNIKDLMDDFESTMVAAGILKGCLSTFLSMGGEVRYANKHLQWMWEQYLRSKGQGRGKLVRLGPDGKSFIAVE